MIADKLLNLNILLISLLPLALISGPLLPDIIIVFSFFLFFFFISNKSFFLKDSVLILFLLFWVSSTLSSLLSSDIIFSIKSSFLYIRFIIFALILSFFLQNNPNFLKRFYIILITAFLILIFDSYFQKIFEFNIIGMKTPHEVRISSFFGDELILGSFLVKFFPIVVGLIYFFNKKNFNLYFFIISSGTFIATIISVEKTAIIIFLIEYLLLFVFLRKKLKHKLILIFIPLLIITFVFNFAPKIKIRIYDQLLSNSANFKYIFTQTHTDHYIASYKIFIDNPIVGIGPKMFRNYCEKEEYKISENSCTTHPHNYSMQILSETGIIGFVIFILIYLMFILDFFKLLLKKHFNNYEFLFFTVVILNLINFMPLFPSGNFFNNWIAITYSIPLGFYYFFRRKSYQYK